MEYTEETTKEAYHDITGQPTPNDTAWGIFWKIANAKVLTDKFRGDEMRIIAACYYIAYLASGAQIDGDGRYASVSKSIGSVSQSVSLGHGTETSNAWLDRYNALITNAGAAHGGGRKVRIPPPATGYRDAVTRRHILQWWRHDRL